MKEQSVTIFVAAKNAETTIEKCVKSLLNVKYKNKKIYIIDNYSSDSTYDILKKFSKKIKLERIGGTASVAHNHALKNIDTEFVAYTDSDVVVESGWLKKLVNGFNSEDIVATAGYVGTPKKANKLQQLVGRELEDRWKNFPQFISRAPTSNLCVRAKIAKKIGFDKNFRWAWETDFGYRLSKLGKIRYISEAVVYHYHRTSWWRFFRQQTNNARMVPLLYFVKHRGRILGDHISTSKMMLTLLLSFLFFASTLFYFLSTLPSDFLKIVLFMEAISILIIFVVDSIKLSRNLSDFFYYLAIFFVRLLGWIIGLFIGVIDLISR